MLKVLAVPMLFASVAGAQVVPVPAGAADDRLYRAAVPDSGNRR